MNVGASMGEWSEKMSVPPYQRTMTMTHVPRNSLMGWADAWRTATLLEAVRNSLVLRSKRWRILRSAVKALMMRIPPRVSSSWAIVSLHLFCASSDWRLSFRPMRPIAQPMSGRTMMVNMVSCQLV